MTEACRFRFDAGDDQPPLASSYKFEPTDADIVAFYLLPRALGLPTSHERAVVEADPLSCPPWELLRRNGHEGGDHAFFFVPPRKLTKNGNVARGSRVVTAVGEGGVQGRWYGQKAQDEQLTLVRAGGAGEDVVVVTFRKYNLTYYCDEPDGDKKKGTPSGWVMHEYQIVDPPMTAVLARVKVADRVTKVYHGKKRKATAAATDEANQVSTLSPSVPPPYQNQPADGGPSSSSNYYYDHHHHVDGGQAAVGTPQAIVAYQQEIDHNNVDGYDMEAPVASYMDLLQSGQGGDDDYSFVDESNNYATMDEILNPSYNDFNQGYDDAQNYSNYGGTDDNM